MSNIKNIYWRSSIYILFDALSWLQRNTTDKRKHLYALNIYYGRLKFEFCDLAFICHLNFDIWYFYHTNGNM